MGVELAAEDFREKNLKRFASQSKTIEAFKLLREHKIKRTSYNVIGFPNQNEESILQTIEFNKILDLTILLLRIIRHIMAQDNILKELNQEYLKIMNLVQMQL